MLFDFLIRYYKCIKYTLSPQSIPDSNTWVLHLLSKYDWTDYKKQLLSVAAKYNVFVAPAWNEDILETVYSKYLITIYVGENAKNFTVMKTVIRNLLTRRHIQEFGYEPDIAYLWNATQIFTEEIGLNDVDHLHDKFYSHAFWSDAL